MKRTMPLLRICGAALALVCASQRANAQTYHVVDLGSLGGIGDAGAFALLGTTSPATVVGFATEASQNHRALIRFNGFTSPIAPLAPDLQNLAFAIDGFGQVFGVSYTLGEVQTHAFRANAAGQVLLGAFTPRGSNAVGELAGSIAVLATDGIWETHACRYIAATGLLTDLGTLAPTASSSAASSINDGGMIVGDSTIAGNLGTRATIWYDGLRRDLGGLGGSGGGAYAINNTGTAVGWSTTAGANPTKHAVRFSVSPTGGPLGVTDLGTLAAPPGAPTWSYAFGVNDAGHIAGQSNGLGFVILRSVGGVSAMQNLNALIPAGDGWTIVTARAIDGRRRIAAMGVNALNLPTPLLLVPCDSDFNRNGSITVQDVFEFLSAWFASDIRADISLDGTVSVQDVFDFLSQWFAGCEA